MTVALDIEPFQESDWPGVWRIIQAVCAAGDTYVYPLDLSEGQARQIWLRAPPSHTVVARGPDGMIVGTAKMGPNHMGPGSHMATASFMVDDAERGRGVGRALGNYAIDWATGQGFRGMQFNAVVESNERAVALWQSLGFDIVGTVPGAFDHPRDGYVGLHIMHRRLDPG